MHLLTVQNVKFFLNHQSSRIHKKIGRPSCKDIWYWINDFENQHLLCSTWRLLNFFFNITVVLSQPFLFAFVRNITNQTNSNKSEWKKDQSCGRSKAFTLVKVCVLFLIVSFQVSILSINKSRLYFSDTFMYQKRARDVYESGKFRDKLKFIL